MFLSLLFTVLLLTCNVSVFATAEAPAPARFPRKIPLITRKFQSWMIRQTAQSKSAQRMHSRLVSKDAQKNSHTAKGSFLTLQRPSKERVFEWFGVEGEDPAQFLRCIFAKSQYNHNKVGITNPLLHIMDPKQQEKSKAILDNHYDEERHLLLHANSPKSKRTVAVSTVSTSNGLTTPTDTLEQSWWPDLQVSPNAAGERAASSSIKRRFLGITAQRESSATLQTKHKDDWRVIVIRKRVGRGQACYEKVRDAALDWEFQSADGSMGMLEVPATCPPGAKKRQRPNGIKEQQQLSRPFRSSSRYIVQPVDVEESSVITGYRSLGSSSRRLISFSSKTLAGFLPEGLKKRLYVVNPVMVVYDLMDQRAPGTTFTSTAYATLQGHWLSGEERVSVALRDGTQYVDVEILSVSRSGPSLWGRAVWPFVGKMQSNFFQEHLKHLQDVATSCSNAMEPDGVDVSIPWSLPVQQGRLPPAAITKSMPAFASPMSSRDPFWRDDEVTVAFESGAI
jgi:uncharacterized protein (UPF0548 family)